MSSSGVEYVLVELERPTGPLADRRIAYHVEAYLPIIGTTWLLIISATVPSRDMVDDLRNIVTRMVDSVRAYPEDIECPVTQVKQLHEVGDAYFTHDSAQIADS